MLGRDTVLTSPNPEVIQFLFEYIFIIYICLKQNYIKQYKSLQTNTLFSGYRILKLTGSAKKGAIQDF